MIDLHTHTNRSDGTDTPRELINAAIIQGLNTIALTDHDSIAGWNEAKSALRGDLNLVLGAEISCLTEEGTSVHMLGLLFNGDDADILSMMEQTRDDRIPRMVKMIELLNAAGIEVTMHDVDAVKEPGATVGRPHLADALVARGHITSRDAAFQGLLNNESEFYVAHLAPTPEEAIRKIRAAGGVAVIAHPFASHRGKTLASADFTSLEEAGLNGIEVDHRDQNPSERQMLRAIAHDLDLVVTGSSDYHGGGKLNRLGENSTDPGEWARLEAMADERRVVKL
ncbi:MAG TPA: PHP domain-containing protein [Candidatus Nanopelagicaceae bacterium]